MTKNYSAWRHFCPQWVFVVCVVTSQLGIVECGLLSYS